MNRPIMSPARRTVVALLSIVALLVGSFAAAAPASAAAADKLTVLSDWTQTSSASYAQWNAARSDRDAWASYGFDWSTDNCSTSPDQPLGFDFRLSCQRHDFGYRNYKDAGRFPANKARLDSAFYADLKRRCATYSPLVQPACYSLAWTYYTAVDIFGSLIGITRQDLDRADRLTSRNLHAGTN
jgi:opacity protein-like surface antigen